MECKDEEWISEASDLERLYDESHKRGSFLLAYQLSLSSLQPLLEEQVKTTLTHLHKKCPSLRICFGQRYGRTWLRHKVKEEIDFQVMRDATPDEIRNFLQTYQYNSEEGPLWCARLLLNTEGDDLTLDEDLPYTSHLFLGMHHGITDGFTMMKICGAFVRILNDVIAKKPICDLEQIGYFVPDAENDKLIYAKMFAVQQDPYLMKLLISRAEDKGIGMPLLLKAKPPPEGDDQSFCLTRVLDKITTNKFIQKCKAERVSINSGFSTLVNASVVSSLVEHDFVEDNYRMCNGHVINSRRYWPAELSDAMGCHAPIPLNLWINVPRDYQNRFWDTARNLHQDLHRHIKDESILLREAYLKLTKKGGLYYDDNQGQSSPMQVDSVFSNLGDVTSFFEDSEPYVKPYLLVRQASLHRTHIKNLAYFIHTLRGRLIVCLLYNTMFYTKDAAQKHLNNIFAIMENVINGSFC